MALGFIVPTLVLALTPPPPKKCGDIRDWMKKAVEIEALVRLAGKSAEAMPGILGSIMSWLLGLLLKTVTWLDQNLWAYIAHRTSAGVTSEPTEEFIEEKPKVFLRKALGSLREKVTGIQKRKKYSGQKPKQPLVDSLPHASLVDYPSVTPSIVALKELVSDTSMGDVASISSQDSPEDLSSDRSGSQITTLEETHECFEDVEKLTEDLHIVDKEKDNKIMQLSPLYTAEWQNTLRYLSRNIGSLSRLQEQQSRLDTTDYECHDHPMFGDSSEIPTDFPGTDIQRKQKQKGHVLQIRQFQEGRLGRTPLYAILERIIAEDKAAIAHEGIILSMEQGDRLVYVMGTPVLCPKLHLDAARANTMWCHITKDGELINSPSHTPSYQERHRLQRYWGTCSSTPIPLPPPHSTLTPVYSTPRYWETLNMVQVVREMWYWPVLEMGVSEAGQVDRGLWVSNQRRSWCVCVESCVGHLGSICTTVYRQGKQGECQQNTMSRTPGTQATFHYGLVLDVARGRLAFLDLNREIVLAKFDEMFTEDLYPMFGVSPLPERVTVNMKLVNGEDIDITDTKKSLIHDALT
ncbi:uncharacterized protein LOC124272954 [Haliotis rubra]|uniref:uncharacterized protein LOC124272954 n=1 Tax=Haliotis rubra TaxID=36100 RepID=UPI001EE54360|nr:uncharacterized protein LOC124272954 [Haliotis rubra]